MTRDTLAATDLESGALQREDLIARSFDIHRSWIAREFGLRHFVPLRENDLDTLEEAGTIERYPVDAPLFRQGEPAEATFLIRGGEVDLWRDSHRPRVHLSKVGPGRVLGDLEMFTDETYYSTAIASSPVTALHLPKNAVMRALVTNPNLAIRWLVAALRQFEESQKRISQLLLTSAKSKLALFLLDEADDAGRVESTHREIAELLGLERATVSRIIEQMRTQGYVETGRGEIVVLDFAALGEITDGAWPE